MTTIRSQPRRSGIGSAAVGAKTAYIAPESPSECGFIEGFMLDELLEGENPDFILKIGQKEAGQYRHI